MTTKSERTNPYDRKDLHWTKRWRLRLAQIGEECSLLRLSLDCARVKLLDAAHREEVAQALYRTIRHMGLEEKIAPLVADNPWLKEDGAELSPEEIETLFSWKPLAGDVE